MHHLRYSRHDLQHHPERSEGSPSKRQPSRHDLQPSRHPERSEGSPAERRPSVTALSVVRLTLRRALGTCLVLAGTSIYATEPNYWARYACDAARDGDNAILTSLQRPDASFDIPCGSAQTPLLLAVANLHPSTVKLLLSSGAEVDYVHPDGGVTALAQAAVTLDQLEQAGYDPIAFERARLDGLFIVRSLLEAGANVDCKVGDVTPVFAVARRGDPDLTAKLLVQGAPGIPRGGAQYQAIEKAGRAFVRTDRFVPSHWQLYHQLRYALTLHYLDHLPELERVDTNREALPAMLQGMIGDSLETPAVMRRTHRLLQRKFALREQRQELYHALREVDQHLQRIKADLQRSMSFGRGVTGVLYKKLSSKKAMKQEATIRQTLLHAIEARQEERERQQVGIVNQLLSLDLLSENTERLLSQELDPRGLSLWPADSLGVEKKLP